MNVHTPPTEPSIEDVEALADLMHTFGTCAGVDLDTVDIPPCWTRARAVLASDWLAAREREAERHKDALFERGERWKARTEAAEALTAKAEKRLAAVEAEIKALAERARASSRFYRHMLGPSDALRSLADDLAVLAAERGEVERTSPGPIALSEQSDARDGETGHTLTEYGTTDCPIEGVRATVDDGECSAACGAPVGNPQTTIARTCGCAPDAPPCQRTLDGRSGHLYGDGRAHQQRETGGEL